MNIKFKYIYRIMISLIGLFVVIVLAFPVREETDMIKNQDVLGIHNTSNKNETVQISNVIYNKDGILAQYPKLIQGGSEKELNVWNQIIQEDFNKILEIYSFNPIPGPTPSKSGSIPTILEIKYDIKDNNKYLSILWNAAYSSKFVAHPSDLVYTTNISKADGKRLKLSDIVKLNKDFVKDFRTWKFISIEENNSDLNEAIKDYVANLSDEDLLMGFQAADIIGSGNHYGIYTYLTKDRLGISLGAPHYVGDHVEFEKEYTELKGFLNRCCSHPDFLRKSST